MSDELAQARTYPLLAAPSPSALSQWYVDQLGFPKCHKFGDDYAIVARGALELHFWRCPERRIAENTSCYVELSAERQQDSLHQEWLKKSTQPGFHPGRLSHPPKTFDHGMREFYVWDPAGNLLRFGVDTTTKET